MIDSFDEKWRDLVDHESLAAWLRDVSADPSIRDIYRYGATSEDDSRSDRLLRDAAFRFANQQSLSVGPFDEAAVRAAAVDFWAALTAQEETWEIGGILFHATLGPEAPDEIVLGEHVIGDRQIQFSLRRLTTDWAAARYRGVEGAVAVLGVVVALITEPRDPFRPPPARFDRNNSDDLLLRQATLPIRLAAQHSGFVMPDFRLHHPPALQSGWRADDEVLRRLDEVTGNGPNRWPTFSDSQIREIIDTGAQFVRPKPALDYMNQSSTEPLVLALGRYLGQDLARSPQDLIIDLAVALETLFSDGREEITQKVRTRAALLVGRDASHSRRIYRFVADFYNVRSRLVHGSSRRPGRKTPSIDDDVLSALRRWEPTTAPADSARGRMGQLARIMSEVIRDGLRAYVWLSTGGEHDPAGETFQATLDCLAFSQNDRDALQRAGHLR